MKTFDEALINQQNVKICISNIAAWAENLSKLQLSDQAQEFLDDIDEVLIKHQLIQPRQKIDLSNVLPFKKPNS